MLRTKYFSNNLYIYNIYILKDFMISTRYILKTIVCRQLQTKCIGHFAIKCVVGNSIIECTADYFALKMYCW